MTRTDDDRRDVLPQDWPRCRECGEADMNLVAGRCSQCRGY